MTTFNLLFVGTGGFHAAHWKDFPCIVLKTTSARLMFDCGDGSLRALQCLEAFSMIDLALLTGGTAEETLGLVAVADRVAGARQQTALPVICPLGAGDTIRRLAALKRSKAAPLAAREAQPGEAVYQDRCVTVTAFELARDERDRGLGYVIQEHSHPGRVDVEKAARLGLGGAAIGKLVNGEAVNGIEPGEVVGPPRPGRRVVIVGRTRPCIQLSEALVDADVAVMAAGYIDERFDVAVSSNILTGWEAAQAAAEAGTRTVALYNVSASNPDRVMRAEASQFHSSLFTPADGDQIVIPLPDVGPVRYLRHPRQFGDRRKSAPRRTPPSNPELAKPGAQHRR